MWIITCHVSWYQSQRMASHDMRPHHIRSHQITSHHIKSSMSIAAYCKRSYNVMSCHPSYHAISYHITTLHFTSLYTCHTILCHASILLHISYQIAGIYAHIWLSQMMALIQRWTTWCQQSYFPSFVLGSSDHTKTSKAGRKNMWKWPCRNWMRLALNCKRSPYGIGTNAHQVYILVDVYHREMSFSWAQQRWHWETDEFLSLGLVFPTTPPQGNTKTPKNSCVTRGRRVHLVWLPGMANLIWLDGVLALNHPRISAHF